MSWLEKIFKCHTCSRTCARARYVNTQLRGFQLCVSCFSNGRFPIDMSSREFMLQYGPLPAARPDPWSDEEMLSLLEGVEAGEDWPAIAARMDKTPEECIRQFTSLDYADSLVACESVDDLIKTQTNPLMYLISLLHHAVHPSVASIAAQNALNVLDEETEPDDTWSLCTAQATFERVLDHAKTWIELEQQTTRQLVQKLQILQLEMLQAKMTLAESLNA